MFKKEVIQHLRIRFSLLLMPVFWLSILGLSIITDNAISFYLTTEYFIAFVIWHLLIYPASNAYNGFQDQDTGSIGDIKNPSLAGRPVFIWSLALNILGIFLSFLFIGNPFGIGVLVYAIVSILYSWRKVRLKKYPVLGFLSVFIFQGFWVVLCNAQINAGQLFNYGHLAILGLAASFMFGGGYPITQVYQHQQDRADGVNTISMALGIKGTFIFSGIMNAIGLGLLFYLFVQFGAWFYIPIYLIVLGPSLVFFASWFNKVLQNPGNANFEQVMKMTWISAICNNLALIVLILLPYLNSYLLD